MLSILLIYNTMWVNGLPLYFNSTLSHEHMYMIHMYMLYINIHIV